MLICLFVLLLFPHCCTIVDLLLGNGASHIGLNFAIYCVQLTFKVSHHSTLVLLCLLWLLVVGTIQEINLIHMNTIAEGREARLIFLS